jgi:hypothetical protein
MGCTVNPSTGAITVINASLTCLVLVAKAEDTNYNAASAASLVILNKANQVTLTVTGPVSVTYGTTGTITYSGGSGSGALSYSQGSSTGCMVDPATGVITVTNASLPCTVAATKEADNNYLVTTSAGFGVTLNKAPGSVNINNIPVSAFYGGRFTPTFTKLGDGLTFLTSLTPVTCTVSTLSGIVYFTGIGTCTLQALVAEGSNHLAATGIPQSFIIEQGPGFLIYLPWISR